MLFKELFELYYKKHAALKLRSPQNIRWWFSAHGGKWSNCDVAHITKMQIQDWVDSLGEKSRSSATRAVNVMSAIFNWGIKRGYVSSRNPCIGVERFSIKPRERFLLPEELEKFRTELEKEDPLLKDFFWMCLFTGARRGNVLAMRWDELDTTLAIWRFDNKNDESHIVALTSGALAILERRKQYDAKNSQWVFPSPRKKDAHFNTPQRQWQKIITRANLGYIKIHDLRRTLGSYMAIQGESTYIIGKALGHKDQRSTSVYAKLHLAPVRRAIQDVQSTILGENSRYMH